MGDGITILPDETNASHTAPPGNGRKPAKAAGPGLEGEGQGGATEAIVAVNSSKGSTRRATGPRTEIGKRRSRANAVKHGILSAVVMREGEDRSALEAIHARLEKTKRPVGEVEVFLVEKLAVLFWRYRRLIKAEAGEIALKGESIRYRDAECRMEAFAAGAQHPERGLISNAISQRSAEALALVIEKLRELHDCIQKDGLDWQRDRRVLKYLYGTLPENASRVPRVPLEPAGLTAESYRELTPHAETDKPTITVVFVRPPESSENTTNVSPVTPPAGDKTAGDGTSILALIDEEIRRLESLQLEWAAHKKSMERWENLTAALPRIETSELLLRYEASLERSIDRTLVQLEREQRMRLGQPVPPPLKLELSP